ncbi:MAG TPA: nucleoside-triphosphatase [Saprospiraceae bacterium]|nr:nucleoside-triphosphatase [Saprospiraceae bacterium]
MSLYVLTGLPGSGKTTALACGLAGRSDVGGFLSPLRNNRRWFYLIRTKEWLPMEWEGQSDSEVLEVGRYVFLKSAFALALSALERDFKLGVKNLVLDEFGPLERMGKGLMPGVEGILKEVQNSDRQHLVVVIRSLLLDEFLRSFPLAVTASISDWNADLNARFFQS